MNKIKHTSVVLVAVSLVSCGTSTRFGDMLIPAHKSSYAKKNEEVKIIVGQKIEESKVEFRFDDLPPNKEANQRAVEENSTTNVASSFILDYASKRVIEEIKNESKKYTQQYSSKERFSRGDGIRKINLKRTVTLNGVEGRHVASNVELELSTFNMGSGLTGGYLDLKSITLNNSKAKIVSLNCKNPLKWAVGLLLKTGNYVNVQVHVSLKGLTKSGQVVILDSEMLSKPAQIALDKAQKVHRGKNAYSSISVDFTGSQLGDWFVTGRTSSGNTPLVIEVTVTETDPSNIQEKLQKGVDKIEEKRNTLLGN